ncbi:J domain-containing protein [Almyronema epifaneia]|uniref:DnaJ domain-containing protein n=1 Tax=Almyronema epifaneia S1 TaxID=2991925 RepID=A0ABW6IF93_9CYAN
MSQKAFSQDWLKKFADPYAVLGVSVAADERRILKRYRQVAKQLHPDILTTQEPEVQAFTNQLLARLVNPAYQRLKQDKGRAETLATLRFKVRRLSREGRMSLTGQLAQQLMEVAETEVDVLYEKALSDLSATQFSAAATFEQTTRQLSELNLVYLRRKMGDPIIREKRSGLVSATETGPVSISTKPAHEEATPINYAERHAERAREYLMKGSPAFAVQELRDAVRIEPKNSVYHTLLGQAYLLQNLTGMAKVHFRQALKLNAKNATALKYAKQLDIDLSELNGHVTAAKKPRKGFFGLFSRD